MVYIHEHSKCAHEASNRSINAIIFSYLPSHEAQCELIECVEEHQEESESHTVC